MWCQISQGQNEVLKNAVIYVKQALAQKIIASKVINAVYFNAKYSHVCSHTNMLACVQAHSSEN